MGRPTFNPLKDIIAPQSLSSKAKTNLTTVTCGGSSTGAFNRMLLVGGAENPRITSVKWFPHAAISSSTANIWKFNLVNGSSGATLNSAVASLSGQAIAATGYKDLLVDNGNSSLGVGGTLQIRFTVSGVPDELNDSSVVVAWEPVG